MRTEITTNFTPRVKPITQITVNRVNLQYLLQESLWKLLLENGKWALLLESSINNDFQAAPRVNATTWN